MEGEDEVHPSKRPRVAERVAKPVPHEVEAQNSDFDVIEFLRSSPNPVVASVFGDCEVIRRAAVRRGYPVMRSRFLNFGDDIHDQSVRDRMTDAIQRVPPRLSILASIMPPLLERERARIHRERAPDFTIFEWVVSLCELQEATGNMFLVENPVGASSWNQSAIKRFRSVPISFEGISYLCMFEVKDPRSRRVLKRPVRFLTNSAQLLRFVVRKSSNKHVHGPVKRLRIAYRSSSCWHTRAWGQAVTRGAESDAVKRLEAYPAEDVVMDLARTAIPDDEFHEEPHLEEAKVPEEVPIAVRLAIMHIHTKSGAFQ